MVNIVKYQKYGILLAEYSVDDLISLKIASSTFISLHSSWRAVTFFWSREFLFSLFMKNELTIPMIKE